jgi:hypothetical protein
MLGQKPNRPSVATKVTQFLRKSDDIALLHVPTLLSFNGGYVDTVVYVAGFVSGAATGALLSVSRIATTS